LKNFVVNNYHHCFQKAKLFNGFVFKLFLMHLHFLKIADLYLLFWQPSASKGILTGTGTWMGETCRNSQKTFKSPGKLRDQSNGESYE